MRTLAELVRLPAVFTAAADIVLGFFLAARAATDAGAESISWHVLPLGIAASISLYWGGMVLNDYFDALVDAAERPTRPVPSGRITREAAGRIGAALLLLGVILAWAAAGILEDYRAGVAATVLAANIWAYDSGFKRSWEGVVAMGLCRALNVILGSTLVSQPPGITTSIDPHVLVAAAGVGIYVAGVTWFARKEATVSKREHLAGAAIVMACGIGVASCHVLVWLLRPLAVPPWWWAGPAMLAALLAWPILQAIRNPAPANVQAAIRHCLASLLFLDALLVSPASTMAAIAILAMYPPMRLLGQLMSST